MKLYLPGSSVAAATLPSIYTQATWPWTNQGITTYHLEAISDNRPMPFYPLSNYPPLGGPNADAGVPNDTWRQEHIYDIGGNQLATPDLGKLEIWPFQLFTCGIPLSVTGATATLSVEWVCGPTIFAPCSFVWCSGVTTPVSGLGRWWTFVPFVYVYRPSTQAVVGYLSRPTTTIMAAQTSTPYYGGDNESGTANGSNTMQWKANQSIGMNGGSFTRANVAGVQTGDYVVYEVWGAMSGARTFVGGWSANVRFFVGQGKCLEITKQEDGKRYQAGASVGNDQYYLANTDERSFGFLGPPTGVTFFYWNDLAITSAALSIGFPNVGAPCPPTEVIAGGAQACNAFTAPTGGTATDI